MKIGSLCTGYGGLDMAVEAYFDAEMVWCAENDKYAAALIEQRFNKPNLGDIKQIDWDTVEPIDILTAGYPCQPFSHAGQRKGTEDERHIWPYIIKAISTLRPKYIVLENVRGHLSLGFSTVLADLTKIGYDARWQIVRASDIGAPHQRARLFIIAYSKGCWSGIQQSRNEKEHAKSGNYNQFIANSNGQRSQIPIKGQITSKSESTSIGNSKIITDTHSDAREESRRTDTSIRTASDGLQAGQNEGKTRCEYRCSCEVVTNANNTRGIGHMQRLSKRFNSSYDMCLQEIPNTLVDGKLNARFVEYMMGLPVGWVTDLDLSRSQQLKMLGNGVVPQQAYYALELLHE